jgi:hypothetical protein
LGAQRAICTIIAKNYISRARTLCNSFKKFHPDLPCYVLVVDHFESFIDPTKECFDLVDLSSLKLPNVERLCFKYSILELCTAVKAHLIDYLFQQRGITHLLYIDPDVLITNPLDDVFDRLDHFDILLTPHADKDYPDDALTPNTGTLLRYGVYNLGFIGVRATAGAFEILNWWGPKLLDRCIDDPLGGYYVDQKFMNLAPLFFDKVGVEKGPGLNVAYWNLHSRRVDFQKGIWRCNESLLYFFHFSNFDPEQPELISGYQTRYRLANRPDLQALFAIYTRLLFENGNEESRGWPYDYNYFRTGQPIPYELRVLYRDSHEKWDYWGDPFASPELMRKARRLKQTAKGAYALNALAHRYRKLVR